MPRGTFVISLDFELFWGVIDWRSLDAYAGNLRGVRPAVAGMLELFQRYDVHVTWATVGFLFLTGMDDLLSRRPSVLPEYRHTPLDPYRYAARAGASVPPDLHFAPDVIETILATPGQELATHSLSHFCCLEEPASLEAFRSDLAAAIAIADERFGARITSLVFPRNQYTDTHVRAAGELGITAYRGNPDLWMHTPRPQRSDTLIARAFRFADAYVPVTRDVSFVPGAAVHGVPVNVKASRYLRPWTPQLQWTERLVIGRITRELAAAAARGRTYHLWWHPHNFGLHPSQNLAALRAILDTFAALRRTHGMQSLTMQEVAAATEGTGA
ncbi:MAG TPA: hypothetical protein VGC90_09875 [Candidatus Limnocylindrales bacterium]|jgi:peptidoglycan/xylan/chitin deacetylase (PgdA/CDA1 family)